MRPCGSAGSLHPSRNFGSRNLCCYTLHDAHAQSKSMLHALAASVLHCACRIMPTPQCNVAFASHAHNLSQQHQSHHTGGLCPKAQCSAAFASARAQPQSLIPTARSSGSRRAACQHGSGACCACQHMRRSSSAQTAPAASPQRTQTPSRAPCKHVRARPFKGAAGTRTC